MMFRNRKDAGIQLASRLLKYRNTKGVVLAVPRGAVPIAYEIALELNLPVDVVLIKKLGHPFNKEYAIGAVGLKESFVIPHEDVSEDYIENEIKRLRVRLKEMQQKFLFGREPEDLKGKTVILVDDGIATGNTLLTTIKILKKSHPSKIVLAVPVASRSAFEKLLPEADEFIVLLIPEKFYGVGVFYEDFTQVTDEEVISYLNKLHAKRKAG